MRTMNLLIGILPLMVFSVTACKPEAGDTAGQSVQSASIAPDPAKPETFIGLTLEKAKQAAEAAGVRWRVIEEDGVSKPVTRDYDPARLNFVLKKGLVTAATHG